MRLCSPPPPPADQPQQTEGPDQDGGGLGDDDAAAGDGQRLGHGVQTKGRIIVGIYVGSANPL